MRRSKHRYAHVVFLSFTIALLLFLSSFPALSTELDRQRSEYDSIQNRLNDTKKQLEAAKNQETTLLGQLNALDKSIQSLEKEIDQLERQLAAVSEERRKTEEKLVSLEQQLAQKIEELEHTKVELAKKTEILNERLENIYKRGRVAYLEVVLGSATFNDFISRLSLMRLILEQDQMILSQVKELKEALEIQKAQVEAERLRVETERSRLVEQENEIASITQTKQAKKDKLESEARTKQDLLAQVRRNRTLYAQAERDLENTSQRVLLIIRSLEQGSSGSAPAGKLLFPTSGPISSGFGMRWHPIFGGYRMHTGIDISAPYGQNIVAAEAGSVIYANWLGGYGLTAIIDHGGGISTLYAHVSTILVREGSGVGRGSVIAKVGSTGYSTGPHLHFEVRLNGVPQNPLNWLQ